MDGDRPRGDEGPAKGPHVCVDVRLPQQLMLDAAERAIAENPQNAGAGEIVVERRPGLDPVQVETFGAVLTGKRWGNGRVLRIRHLDGEPDVHTKVERSAREWQQAAGITLDFGDHAEADIRISYGLDGQSWSYIGTDALSIPEPEDTMHYGWLTADTPDGELRRVVLHEFGHALGMIHEHQHPDHGIRWDRQVVYDYYVRRLGWTRQQVDSNLFAAHARGETQFNDYDPLSIMHYPVPAEFTEDRTPVGWNTELSKADRTFIAAIYPKPARGMPAGAFGAPPAIAAAPAPIVRRWG